MQPGQPVLPISEWPYDDWSTRTKGAVLTAPPLRAGKSVVHLAMYYGVYDSMERETPSASTLLNRFVNADDAWRSKRFKIIPKVDCMIQRRVATRHALSESQHHSARWQGAAGVQQQCLSSHRQPVCNTDS